MQSTRFFCGSAPGLATEAAPLALNASPAVSAKVRTYTQAEERVPGAPNLDAFVLRYGFFYGPGTCRRFELRALTQSSMRLACGAASNAKAKRELNFTPRPLEWLQTGALSGGTRESEVSVK